MQEVASLLGIAATLSIGVASPGPSFVMIARTAASSGRASGLRAALGMGLGGLTFAIASLMGMTAVFLAVPTLYVAFKVLGGLYLAYLGLRIWQGARQPLDVSATASADAKPRSNFLLQGYVTQVSNPKTAIVYASVFAAFLPTSPSIQYNVTVGVLVLLIEAGWYALVASVLSTEAPRNTYLRYKKWVDRCAGGVMGALGLKLAVSAAQH